MAGEYNTAPLGEVASVRSGFPFKSSDWTDQGIPVVKIGNVKDGCLVMDGCSFVSQPVAESAAEFALRAGDILIAMTGYIGDVAIVRENDLPALLNQRVGRFLVLDPRRLDQHFLFYLLRDPDIRQEIEGLGYGSAQPNVSPSLIHGVEVPLPPLPEQRAIAHILGTLDDKIELNRRMNETLEAMARAIFKSWFVDFDPVRAKMEGRWRRGESLPGLPAPACAEASAGRHLYDLFPDRLVDSELGEIPEGWGVAMLGDHFDAVKGVSYKGSGLGKSGLPLHNLNSIYEGGGYKYEGIKYYAGEYAERHVVRPGDVIVANTEQGHDRLLIGYAAIVPKLFGSRGIASHHIYRLRPKPRTRLTATFLCHLLNSQQMHDVVSGYANGTTVNMLPIDGVQKPKILCPPQPLVTTFDSLAAAAEQRREEMVLESRTLAALRDTLLPKLISGELRVKDAERIIGRIDQCPLKL